MAATRDCPLAATSSRNVTPGSRPVRCTAGAIPVDRCAALGALPTRHPADDSALSGDDAERRAFNSTGCRRETAPSRPGDPMRGVPGGRRQGCPPVGNPLLRTCRTRPAARLAVHVVLAGQHHEIPVAGADVPVAPPGTARPDRAGVPPTGHSRHKSAGASRRSRLVIDPVHQNYAPASADGSPDVVKGENSITNSNVDRRFQRRCASKASLVPQDGSGQNCPVARAIGWWSCRVPASAVKPIGVLTGNPRPFMPSVLDCFRSCDGSED